MLYGVAVFEITVTGDVKGVSKLDSRLLLASARAIDDTGKFAQTEVIRELDEEFVLRGNWYRPKTRYGINFIPTQKGNLTGLLYTRADWLLEQEGYNRGVKEPEDGEHLADPEDPVTRGAITKKFPRTQKASYLLLNAQGPFTNLASGKRGGRAAGHFKVKSKYGGELIYQRVRLNKAGEVRYNKQGRPIRGRVTGKGNTGLVLKHVLKKSVKVEKHFILFRTTRSTYRTWYGEFLGRNLLLALRTAK
jgi:hypothetical protein